MTIGQAGFALRGRNPDVLTCIANLSNDEVFTPPELANQMLDVVESAWAENHDGATIWSDSKVTLSKASRRRLISSAEPSEAVNDPMAPDSSSTEAEMQSSTSIGLTRVATRPNSDLSGPMR